MTDCLLTFVSFFSSPFLVSARHLLFPSRCLFLTLSPEDEVLHNIFSAQRIDALDGPIRALDAKFKNFTLATHQLYEEPRLWEPGKFDVTHMENLIGAWLSIAHLINALLS